jgi:DNA polymerase III subunit delta
LKLALDSLARHLERQLLPIYLISGDEPLLAAEAADAIRARARALGFSEREVHFLDRGTDWDAIRGAVGTLSLFASRRIIELKLPSGKAGVAGGRALAGMIQSAGEDTLLLIVTGRLDRDAQNAEWVRTAEARGGWLAVWPVPAERMLPWLEARCRRLELAADAQALELLADRTQGNLLAAQQELDRLKLLAGRERVTAERVLASAADSARFGIGELSEALVAGRLARALRVLDGLKSESVEPPLALWAVVKAMHELWSRCRDSGDRPRAASLPFRRLVERAVRADGMAKGRLRGDAWDELSLLACDLCGQPALSLPAMGLQ